MNLRRVPVVVLVVALIAGVVAMGFADPSATTARFAPDALHTTPYIPSGNLITSTWYCPGVPAAGDQGNGREGGEVIVANLSDVETTGRITVYTPDSEPLRRNISVPPREQLVVSVDDLVTAVFAGVVVELDGGNGVVEQRAIHPAGAAVQPCANSASSTWYFADGFTVDGSTDQLVLFNPFSAPTVVDLTFVTGQGTLTSPQFRGFVIPPESVRVIALADAGARDESVLAVSVEATTGQLVALKSQRFLGGGRLGFVNRMGAPSLADQWWFAEGDAGEGVTEQYVVYNPTTATVEVDFVPLGIDFLPATTVTVPAGEVVTFDTSGIEGMPPGRHGMVVSTLDQDSVVVERVLTQPAGDRVATSVVLGAQTSALSGRWLAITSTELAIEDVIVVLNTSYNDGTVTVAAIGPGGEVPVPGLEDLPIPANGVLHVDLTSDLAFGRSLVIESSLPLIVERRLERDPSLRGRSGSLAIPA